MLPGLDSNAAYQLQWRPFFTTWPVCIFFYLKCLLFANCLTVRRAFEIYSNRKDNSYLIIHLDTSMFESYSKRKMLNIHSPNVKTGFFLRRQSTESYFYKSNVRVAFMSIPDFLKLNCVRQSHMVGSTKTKTKIRTVANEFFLIFLQQREQ